MYKIFIIGFLLLLLFGCTKENMSDDLCTELKHSNNDSDITFYMDGNYCVRETINYSHIFIFRCEYITEELNMIIKSQNEQNETLFNELDKYRCNYEQVR